MTDMLLTQESWSQILLEDASGSLIVDPVAVPPQPSTDSVPVTWKVHAGPAMVRPVAEGVVWCDPTTVTDFIRNTSAQAQRVSRVAPGVGQPETLPAQGDIVQVPAIALNAVMLPDAEWSVVRREDLQVYRVRDQANLDHNGNKVAFVPLWSRPRILAKLADPFTIHVWRDSDDTLAARYCGYAVRSDVARFAPEGDYAFSDRRLSLNPSPYDPRAHGYAIFRPTIVSDGVAEFLFGIDPHTHLSVRVFAVCSNGRMLSVETEPAVAGQASRRSSAPAAAASYTQVPEPPEITSPTVAYGVAGGSFGYVITATGTRPMTFSASGLPVGLSVDSSTGAITGTAPAAGSYSVTVTATNAAGSASATVAVTVSVYNPMAVAPEITPEIVLVVPWNAPMSYDVDALNTPTLFTATGLPAGLSIDPATGVISGTPTVVGVSTVVITATNSAGSDTTAAVIDVRNLGSGPAPISITSLSNNVGQVEVGQVVSSVTLNWTLNHAATAQSIAGVGAIGPTLTTYTRTGLSVTTDTSFTLTASDGGSTDSRSTGVSFKNKRWWGVSADAVPTQATVQALSGSELSDTRAQTKSFNATGGRYLYFAWPTSFGAPTFTINGFVNAGWVRTDLTTYVNQSGVPVSYTVYRAQYIQNGNVTVSVT